MAEGDWVQHEGNIYKKTISMIKGYNAYMTNNTTLMANQVFVNGEMMIEARWPNISGENDLLDRKSFRRGHEKPNIVHPADGTWSTVDGITLTDPGIPDIPNGWAGGTIWINGWFISHTRDITAHSGSTLTMSGGKSNFISNELYRRFYYLTGVLGALDTEKEFFYDGTYLYLWQPGGGSPENVEVKKRNFAFDLRGRSDITIKNINIFAASVMTNTKSPNITLDGINAKYINQAVTLTVTEKDIIYSHTGQYVNPEQSAGIRLMGAGSIIKNSRVSFGSSMGIVLGENCTAYNNLVHDINYEGNYGCPIAPYNGASGQKILNNTMYRTWRSCIDMLDSKNMEIGYNNMYHFGMLNIDMGAIYSARSLLQTGSRIHHNWIHDSKAILDRDGGNGIQVGIYFDQNTGGVQVDNNVLWNNLQCDFYAGWSRPESICTIYNNTFATTGNSLIIAIKELDDKLREMILDNMKNNIFCSPLNIRQSPIFNGEVSGTSGPKPNLFRTQDPLFVNTGPGGLVYRIQSNSPAIDTGAVIPGITVGYVGTAPDKGDFKMLKNKSFFKEVANGKVPASLSHSFIGAPSPKYIYEGEIPCQTRVSMYVGRSRS